MLADDAAVSQEKQEPSESNSQIKIDEGTPQQGKNLNEIIQMAQKKGEQTRSSSNSIDNLAKSAWKGSTSIRQKINKGFNTAYSVVTGLANPEVRKEVKKYIDNIQPPNSKK